jgi:DNA-binding protein H-NS
MITTSPTNKEFQMSLVDLIAQKQALEDQIAQTIKTERVQAVETVKTLMEQFSITAKELPKVKAVKATKKVAPKYKDPASDKTWSGRGIKPKWFDEATAVAL